MRLAWAILCLLLLVSQTFCHEEEDDDRPTMNAKGRAKLTLYVIRRIL
jgi:hypothetical protein